MSAKKKSVKKLKPITLDLDPKIFKEAVSASKKYYRSMIEPNSNDPHKVNEEFATMFKFLFEGIDATHESFSEHIRKMTDEDPNS